MLSPRGGLLTALAAAVFCILPDPGRADDATPRREYATVGRIVVRVVEGRTVIVVPVAGRLDPTLSEPFRVADRWRIYLTIHDARLAVGDRTRRPPGVLSLDAQESGGDVRVVIDVAELGEYGARRSEEGILIWIDPGQRPVIASPATASPGGPAPIEAGVEPITEPSQPAGGDGWTGILALALAAVGGVGVRYVRRHGIPAVLRHGVGSIVFAIEERIYERRTRAAPPRAGPSMDTGSVPFQEASADPRGTSAEIGDAFRVEPDRPASGIAALATTIHDNDV